MVDHKTLEAKRRAAQQKASQMIKLAPHLTENGTIAPGTSLWSDPLFPAQTHKNEDPRIKLSSYNVRPLYSQVNIDSDKWLLTMEEEGRSKLECTPSQKDGVSTEMEAEIRLLGCELIQSGSILLKLPQTAAATGQILFQRFYYLKSFAKFHFEHTVMACLLLASKIEEAPRRPRCVVNVFHRLEKLHRFRQAGGRITKEITAKMKPRPLDASYVNLKMQAIKAERRLLAALGFVVHVRHPHKLIFAYANLLNIVDNFELMQKAWSYMNDGLRTDIFVRYQAETIASACVYLASRTVDPKVKLPSTPVPWYELFDAKEEDVQRIATVLLQMYARRKSPNWTDINTKLDLIRFPEGLEKDKENSVRPVSPNAEKNRNGRDRRRDDRRSGRSRSRSRSRRRDSGRRRDDDRRDGKTRDSRGAAGDDRPPRAGPWGDDQRRRQYGDERPRGTWDERRSDSRGATKKDRPRGDGERRRDDRDDRDRRDDRRAEAKKREKEVRSALNSRGDRNSTSPSRHNRKR